MKKKALEINLSALMPLPKSKAVASLEQYATPPHIAADILFRAYALGLITGRSVLDLGCGTGIFSIGASILGADMALGIDVDPEMIKTARENTALASCTYNTHYVRADVSALPLCSEMDTCVMNPPFGAQKRHSDRPFIEAACKMGVEAVFSIHNSVTVDFVISLYHRLGFRVEVLENYIFPIPHTYEFHRKEKVNIEVALVIALRGDDV